MHDQHCSIATLHAKSVGGSAYVQPVTDSVQQDLDGIARIHCNALNLKMQHSSP